MSVAMSPAMSIFRALVLVFAVACSSGCATTLTPAAYRTFDAESASEGELDFHGLPLQSGQLVVSDSGDADSLLTSILGEQYTPYGHAGILSIEDGRAYVYEGYALLWPFLSGPPTDAMQGHIRRVTLKVQAPAIVTAGSLTEGAERVALISKRLTAREVEAYFAAKRELHRRFTDDQKLGNIWSWSWRGLQLRPQIQAFLEASRQWPHETAAELADDWLGAFVQADGRWGKLDPGSG
jgi:hypothetical protein